MSTRSKDHAKPQDMVANPIRAIRICNEKRVFLRNFIVYEPDKVRILLGEVTATLTRQVNELHSTVDDLIELFQIGTKKG